MIQSHIPNLIEVFRKTLQNVEQTSGVHADDPTLAQLREILGRRVARLQHEMASEFASAASEPVPNQFTPDVAVTLPEPQCPDPHLCCPNPPTDARVACYGG